MTKRNNDTYTTDYQPIDKMTESLVIENDTYPETSQSYVISVFDNKDMLHRNFGPFETTEEAKEWFSDYYYNHTKKGFVSRYYINPLCEVK